nr:hypothetical protein [Mammaliicoccus sp. Marseille-Q6498]
MGILTHDIFQDMVRYWSKRTISPRYGAILGETHDIFKIWCDTGSNARYLQDMVRYWSKRTISSRYGAITG